MVLPMAGASVREDELDERLFDYTILPRSTRDTRLNENIRVSHYEIRPQQIDPVTGLGRFTQEDSSTIFASPKQRMKVIPNGGEYPKVLMTTGAVTHPNYRNNRVGRIARLDHVYGAIVVEVDDKDKFQFRQLTSLKNGKFYDLGTLYDGDTVSEARPEALVLGDWHVGDTSPEVREETFKMFEVYSPKRVLLHDFFNGHSINHHELGKVVSQAKGYAQHGLNLETELKMCYDELHEIASHLPDDTEIVLVRSNHDEFLHRYLQDGRFINEPQNVLIASRLLTSYLEGKDPLEQGLSGFGRLPSGVKFLGRDEDYKVRGWQLGQHGDVGANGARGSIRSTENALGKSISGHRHTPEIQRNTFVVGTSTTLQLDYTRGFSSWMNTHAMVYDNGKAQLVNIIDGKHRVST